MLSRILPSTGSPSIYEAIRHDDEASDSDAEERAAMALDEENLRDSLHGYNPDDAADSQVTTQSTAFLGQRNPRKSTFARTGHGAGPSRPRWMQSSRRIVGTDEGDDDVPASLLIEGQDLEEDMPNLPAPPHQIEDEQNPFPGCDPSPSTSPNRWGTRQDNDTFLPAPIVSRGRRPGGIRGMATASAKDKAMWRWANVENLDNFLKDVYIYYLGNGIWSILLNRTLSLLYAFLRCISQCAAMC